MEINIEAKLAISRLLLMTSPTQIIAPLEAQRYVSTLSLDMNEP
jgi:hypothetical protein